MTEACVVVGWNEVWWGGKRCGWVERGVVV